VKKLFIVIGALIFIQCVYAQDMGAYERKYFITGNDTLRYRILYPENYKKRKSYPLIMFLHGSGERGNNNEAQLMHGGDLFLKDDIRKKYPAIVIFPQCPKDSSWARFKRQANTDERTEMIQESATVPQMLVKMLMDSLMEKKEINAKQIYIGGLSMGGMGTFDMVIRNPEYYAAAFPICGATKVPLYVEKASAVPLWLFHGALDNVVLPTYSRELYKALKAKGVETVTYTEYPNANHNSWDSAFAEPQLLPWIFSNKKK
jgi:predicted peptidase